MKLRMAETSLGRVRARHSWSWDGRREAGRQGSCWRSNQADQSCSAGTRVRRYKVQGELAQAGAHSPSLMFTLACRLMMHPPPQW